MQASAGDDCSALLSDAGELYTFGKRRQGVLGQGSVTSKKQPTLVSYFHDNNVQLAEYVPPRCCCVRVHVLTVRVCVFEQCALGSKPCGGNHWETVVLCALSSCMLQLLASQCNAIRVRSTRNKLAHQL